MTLVSKRWRASIVVGAMLGGVLVAALPTPALAVSPSCSTRPVAGAHFNTLTIDLSGHVWAVGRNETGQLGNGSTSGYGPNVYPNEVLGPGGIGYLSNIVSVAGGIRHSLALGGNGNVWAWGDNTYGQLGNPAFPGQSTTPVEVVGLNQVGYLSGIVQVSARDDFSLALKSDGTVYAWGRNGSGQLGDTQTSDSGVPLEVSGPSGSGHLGGIAQISAGNNFSMAMKSDGSVWEWGDNTYGELGQGSTRQVTYTSPVQVRASRGALLTNALQIVAGYSHALAIVSGGSVYAWGHNQDGELGNNRTRDSSYPVLVAGTAAGGPLAAGDSFSLALVTSPGNLSGWGTNGDGEMGNANYSTNYLTPIHIQGIANVTFISAGGYHEVAVLADGTVETWGLDYYGQLGNGDAPVASPTPAASLFPAAPQPHAC